jgi:cell division protein FtsW
MKSVPIHTFDKILLTLTLIITVIGFSFFVSASLGIFAVNSAKFYSILVNQSTLLVLGVAGLFATAKLFPYELLRRYALPIFTLGLLLCFLVFVPGLGFSHGGATRWINLGFTTFQTGEFLKIAAVIYCAGWFSIFKHKIKDPKYGLIPLCCILGLSGVALLLQPDTDTFMVLAVACVAIYFAAGAPWRNLFILGGLGLILIVGLVLARPYILSRLLTFVDGTSVDVRGAGYQAYQSLLTVGSGGIVGQGIGQSVQKFGFLPEPAGDSIFAVIAEETGLIGSTILLLLYLLFFLRIVYIARRAENTFGGLLALGIGILILVQAFLNIGSMIGIVPLSGLPLPLVSHGGTALFLTLIQIGIILNISKNIRTI